MALNEDEQTEAVFKSVRNEVDPVSGNEVPPGSLPEEVRDDIPALLSQGEYVVPADVLRYYGVKFFEDLREQAKTDLAEMDANGRIGGEPVPETEDDLTEDEMSLLGEVMAMNQGGMVPQMNQQQMKGLDGGPIRIENAPLPVLQNLKHCHTPQWTYSDHGNNFEYRDRCGTWADFVFEG